MQALVPATEGALRRRGSAGPLVLGLADEPERQRQPLETLEAGTGIAVLGGPGSGKSSALRLFAAQRPEARTVPSDPEAAWDAVQDILSGGVHPPLVLCDDLDALMSAYPPEYAQEFVSAWEQLVRLVPAAVTLSRVSGALSRVVDGLPRRALLRLTGKVEHLAAGGDPEAFRRDRPAGRARIGAREVQLCWVDAPPQPDAAPRSPRWRPRHALSGLVTPAAQRSTELLRREYPTHRVIGLIELPGAAPSSDEPVIVVADPEDWRMNWALAQRVRAEGEMLVAAECASELRQLAGVRSLPPYSLIHAGRAWATVQGSAPRRVLLPGSPC